MEVIENDNLELKNDFDYEVEELELFDYTLDLIKITDFYNYYERNINYFSQLGRKAFLAAIKIPAKYFMEQPEETRNELFSNKVDWIDNDKIRTKYLVILRNKNNEILNCARVDYDKAKDLYERINISLKETGVHIVREFIKDGYINLVKTTEQEKKGQYNLALYIDLPILLNKKVKSRVGYYFIPFEGDIYKHLYTAEEVEFDEYNDLEIIINDIKNICKEVKESEILLKLEDKQVLREPDDVLTNLIKDKALSTGYAKKISAYIRKKELLLENVYSFVDLILSYDRNLGSYRPVDRLRNCTQSILNFINNKK